MSGRRYTKEQDAWLTENVPGRHFAEVAEMFAARFGEKRSAVTIRGHCNQHGIYSGIAPSENGKAALGTLRVYDDRHNGVKRLVCKVPSNSRPGRKTKWQYAHIVVWEQIHGPIPPGNMIVPIDGDYMHIDPSNLYMIGRVEYGTFLKYGWKWCDLETLEALVNMARVKRKIKERRKGG